MPINDYKDIFVWQKAHSLVLMVYKLTNKYPKDELYGLVSQSRRAAASVPSNIVEGFRRHGTQDDLHFCNIAHGSLDELSYQILLAKDLEYIDKVEYDSFLKLSTEVSKLLNLWIKSKNKKH